MAKVAICITPVIEIIHITSFTKRYPQDLSNRTKIGRIVTFLVLTFGLSTIFYIKIITGGEGIAPWVLR